jgi:hypothetical protein
MKSELIEHMVALLREFNFLPVVLKLRMKFSTGKHREHIE